MKPRAEFVLTSAVIALVLAIVAFVLIAHGGSAGQWLAGMRESLKLAPAAFIAALLATTWATAWHRRAVAREKRWSAGGLTLRTLLLSFLLFPLALAAWLVGAASAGQLGAPNAASVVDSFDWLPLTVLLFTAFAIVLGAVPAFILEYFVSRRYLRRLAAVTTGSA